MTTDKRHPVFWIFFFLLACTNLLAEIIDYPILIFYTKPLLMPSLAFFFWWQTKLQSRFSKLILWALLFAFAGDTLLMFVENGPRWPDFFLFGLLSFLITHLLYLFAFLGIKSKGGFLFRHPLGFVAFLLFFAGNMYLLWPGITPALQIPVAIYSLAIICMVMSAVNLFDYLPRSFFLLLLSGVLLFLISDNLIALRKFTTYQIPQVRLLIMMTYILGQVLIVNASLKINNGKAA